MIQRMQNSLLTSWIWQYWQHGDTGRICLLPFWKIPGRKWFKIKVK